MVCERHACERMVVAFQANGLRIANLADHLNAVTCLRDAETIAAEDLFVTLRMELGEAR